MIVHMRSCWVLVVLVLSGRFLHTKLKRRHSLRRNSFPSVYLGLQAHSKSVEFPIYIVLYRSSIVLYNNALLSARVFQELAQCVENESLKAGFEVRERGELLQTREYFNV